MMMLATKTVVSATYLIVGDKFFIAGPALRFRFPDCKPKNGPPSSVMGVAVLSQASIGCFDRPEWRKPWIALHLAGMCFGDACGNRAQDGALSFSDMVVLNVAASGPPIFAEQNEGFRFRQQEAVA